MLTKPQHEENNKNNQSVIKYHQPFFSCVNRMYKEFL